MYGMFVVYVCTVCNVWAVRLYACMYAIYVGYVCTYGVYVCKVRIVSVLCTLRMLCMSVMLFMYVRYV